MVIRFTNDRQRKAVMRKYNRSIGQFKRYHGTATVGSDVDRLPYFKLVNNMESLVATNPDRKEMILEVGRKIEKQGTLKEQEATYLALLKKLKGMI